MTSISLPPLTPEALAAFRAISPTVIRETVARSLQRTSEVAQHGEEAERLLTAGLEFTTLMLDAAMATGEIPLLEDELSWARIRLPFDGVAAEHVLNRLIIYRDLITSLMPPEYTRQVSEYIDWMIARQRELLA
jgi:hypothetical protein